ncbi:MAG: AsmA family protein [Candidatus Omnitrophica bacterium]|nr:AsmA family protein [Candidatus Omnitrophota bacterium]
MKKIFIMLVVILVLAAGAGAVFIATFDANRYRPLIEQKLSEAVGNPVSIGSIGLTWNGALALEVKDIVIREDGKTALTVQRAAAAVDVMALLSKKVRVPSVEINEPQIVLTRDAAGQIRVGGVRATKSASDSKTSASKPGAAAAAVDFAVNSVKLRGAKVTFIDLSAKPAITIPIRQLDADFKNLALGSEAQFAVKAAIFSNGQNLDLTGKGRALVTGAAELKDVVLKTNLTDLDWRAMGDAIPSARDLPFRKNPEGRITIKLPSLKVMPGSEPEYLAQAEIAGGRVALKGFGPEIGAINLSAQADAKTVTLNSLTAELAGGSVAASGVVRDWMGTRQTSIKAEAKKLRIEQFLVPGKDGKTQFEGELGAAFDGSFASFEWPMIQKNLNGRAVVDLPAGLLLNMNLVREVMGKLDSIFPGIVTEVESRLPASYKPKLTQQSTVLNPFRHTFDISNGVVLIRDLSVATDFFSAGTSGDLSLEGTYEGRGSIQMDQTFSKAMFDGVPLVNVLANAASQVELPLKLRYRNGKFSALPDLDAIGKRIIPQSGKELLSQALNLGAAFGGSSASTAAGTAPAAEGAPAAGGGSSAGGWLSQIQNIAGAALESQKNQQ